MRIGCVCPEFQGHLNPTSSVAKELQDRGHDITFIGRLDAAARIEQAGFGFRAIATEEYRLGSIAEFERSVGGSSGFQAIQLTKRDFVEQLKLTFRDMPGIIEDLRLDGLLIDQLSSAAVTIAEHYQIPYVTQANALPMNEDLSIPPPIFGWPFKPSPLGRCRDYLGWRLFRLIVKSVLSTINTQREAWNLKPYRSLEQSRSPLAELWQSPDGFEFPRKLRQPQCHLLGPLVNPTARPVIEFPYDRLDERPLIYASMGTLQNRLSHVFETIVQACEGLDCQLVVSLGTTASDVKANLPAWPIVVDVAPQLDLLQRASLTITHAGLNTTLESLSHGVPLVAIPVANDQPAVAARIESSGVGKSIPLRKLNAVRLRTAVSSVLGNDDYSANATRLAERIKTSGGVKRAADIIERAITSKQPVRPADIPR